MIDTNKILILAMALLAGAIAGCEVQKAKAPRDALEVQPLPKLPSNAYVGDSANLDNVQFFLWQDQDSEGNPRSSSDLQRDAQEVVKRSKRIDALDDLQDELERKTKPLEAKVDTLNAQKSDLDTERKPLKDEKKKNDKDLKDIAKELKKLQKELDDTTALPESPERDAKIKELQDKITAKTADQTRLTERNTEIDARVAELTDRIEAIKQEVQAVKDELEPLVAEVDRVSQEGDDLLHEIFDVVEFFNTGDEKINIRLNFADGRLSMAIEHWDLNDGHPSRNFTTEGTEDGIIDGLKYTEEGGVLEFDVKVYRDKRKRVRETFRFRVARTKYDARDGGVFFTGDIIYIPGGETNPAKYRRGLAKFGNKNN